MDIIAEDTGDDLEPVARTVDRRAAALQAIASAVLQMRDEAVTGRLTSGIEEIWLEDAEMYEGIDDANRAEEGWNRTRKPTVSGTTTGRRARKSTVLLNITRPYVDGASARVCDMLMPTDDRPWEIKPTPIPEIASTSWPSPDGLGMAGISETQAAQLEALREQYNAKAARRSANAQRRIDDWLTEADWHGHVRKVVHDAARIGTGVIKGPTPIERRRLRWSGSDGQRYLESSLSLDPTSRRISCWDLFPDPACGENIHNGNYLFERDRYWTRKMLGELRNAALNEGGGWIAEELEACLLEGPIRRVTDHNLLTATEDKQFEAWHFYCVLEREDLIAAGCECGEGPVFVPVFGVMINDRIVKIGMNPLDSGQFPYDVLAWSPREGMPWGRGISRMIRTPQRIVTAATRALMDNSGLSSGVILFLRRMGIEPAVAGDWELHANKVFWITDASISADAAVRAVEIPSRQNELLGVVQFAMRMAEDVTGLPQLAQGQIGQHTPDTVGVATIQNNNANSVLRNFARNFDTSVTEPHIRRYNDWLQQYTDDPEEQGDFQVDARGSSALVERDIQSRAIGMMAQFVNDPAFRVNKEKWFAEWSKAQRLDPRRFQYTEDEWKQVQSNIQPPPPPQVQVAQIREQGQTERQREKLLAERELKLIELAADERLTASEFRAQALKLLTEDRRERDLFESQRAVKERFGTSVDMPG